MTAPPPQETSYDVLLRTLHELGPTVAIMTPEKLAARLRDAIALWDRDRNNYSTLTEWGVAFEYSEADGRTETKIVNYTPTEGGNARDRAEAAIRWGAPRFGHGHRLVSREVTDWTSPHSPLPRSPRS